MMSFYKSAEEVRTAAARSLGFGQDQGSVTMQRNPSQHGKVKRGKVQNVQMASDGTSATLTRVIPDDASVSKAEAILADVSQSVLADMADR